MWSLNIGRVRNGYVLTTPDLEGEGPAGWVIEDGDDVAGLVNLTSGEALLWEVMDFFNFGGSKHDTSRIRVVVEDKYNDE